MSNIFVARNEMAPFSTSTQTHPSMNKHLKQHRLRYLDYNRWVHHVCYHVLFVSHGWRWPSPKSKLSSCLRRESQHGHQILHEPNEEQQVPGNTAMVWEAEMWDNSSEIWNNHGVPIIYYSSNKQTHTHTSDILKELCWCPSSQI